MPIIQPGQLDQHLAAPAVAGKSADDFWNPQNIKSIIEGISNLMRQYRELRGQLPGQDRDNGAAAQQPVQLPPNVVTKDQLFGFIRQTLANLEQQGYGDKTLSDVLNELPYTIKQLRGMLQ